MPPRFLVVEAARIFDAEAAACVGVFARHAYQWKVLSNDPAWLDPAWPTTASIATAIEEFNPTIIHFALHGTDQGLVLRISKDQDEWGTNDTDDILLWETIERMPAWRGRVVITGACGMLNHAGAFLRAGTQAVVAPSETINWGNLCHFFRLFYSSLLGGESVGSALATTKAYAGGYYEGFESIQVVGNSLWRLMRHSI